MTHFLCQYPCVGVSGCFRTLSSRLSNNVRAVLLYIKLVNGMPLRHKNTSWLHWPLYSSSKNRDQLYYLLMIHNARDPVGDFHSSYRNVPLRLQEKTFWEVRVLYWISRPKAIYWGLGTRNNEKIPRKTGRPQKISHLLLDALCDLAQMLLTVYFSFSEWLF